jgi:transposase-like protein
MSYASAAICYEAIICPRCSSVSIVKNGKTAQRKQRFLCKDCRRQFIRDYANLGCVGAVRDLVVPLTINGAGIRDIERILFLSANTILKTLREAARDWTSPRTRGACATWKWMSSGRSSAPSGDSAGPGTATTGSDARSSPSSMNGARTPLAANSCRNWRTAGSRVTTRISGSLTPSSYRLGDTGPAKKVRAGLSATT